MGISDENYQENIRYSFLLGCALRNDDIDQFFQVYDAIVPKDLPVDKVDHIKEEARRIAELPDDQFNDLAIKAKELSLARGLNMEEQKDAVQSVSLAVGPNPQKLTLKSVERTSRHLAPSVSSETADDSGVFEDSRNTTDYDKQFDSSDDIENGRAGSFDYFPYRTKNDTPTSLRIEHEDEEDKVRLKKNRGYKVENEMYDEAYKAGSDSSGTPRSNDLCSPRSDISSEMGTEMKTYKFTEGNSVDDNDINLENVNVHRRLYGSPSYTPMLEDDEPVYDEHSSNKGLRFNFTSTHISRTYRQPSDLCDFQEKDIDSEVRKRKLRGPPCNGSIDQPLNSFSPRSYGTNVKKTEFSNPPFGDPVCLNKVCHSAGELITGQRSAHAEIHNLPEAAEIQGNTKKKKKKKNSGKDEAGSESSESSQGSKDHASYDLSSSDVNGNPLRSSARTAYTKTNGFKSDFPSKFTDFDSYSSSMTGNRDLSSSIEHKERFVKMQKRREARKEKDQKHVIASVEGIQGYRGEDSIDNLLSFIENESSKKKKKNSATKEHMGENKKKKDKKINDFNNTMIKKEDKTSSETGSETYEDVGVNDVNDSSSRDIRYNGDDRNLLKQKQEKNSKPNTKIKNDKMKVENEKNKPKNQDDNGLVNGPLKENNKDLSNFVANLSIDYVSEPSIYSDNIAGVSKAPVEEEFQEVVGKKKKKTIQKELPPPPPCNSSFKEVNYNHMERVARRVKTPRSITPPPITAVEGYNPEPRDLSPSAFPALSAREGRRNSAGDIPRNRLPLQQDDSDLESVKSLPVDSSTVVVDHHKSHISYAQIAASPKPNAQSIQNTGINSPRSGERRHSFDSLEKKDSNTDESELKTRSQELPICDPSDKTNTPVARKCLSGHFESSPATTKVDCELLNKPVESSSSKEQLDSCSVEPYNGPAIMSSSSSINSNDSDKSKTLSTHTSSSSSSSISTTNSMVQISGQQTTLNTGATTNARSSKETDATMRGSKSSKKQQKYLVFLDGNYMEKSSKFEFSFGFENSLDNKVKSENIMPKNGMTVPVAQAMDTLEAAQTTQSNNIDFQFKQTTELKLPLLETDRGNFNVEDIVDNLLREWNRVMDVKRKRPESVTVYQSDV